MSPRDLARSRVRGAVLLAPALAWVLACGEAADSGAPDRTEDAAAAETWFEPAGEESGLDFVHVRATRQRFWFPEIMSGGAAWLDYDGDGHLDLYLVQGGDLEGRAGGPGNRLFRNRGGGRFADVTEAVGVGDTGYGMGALAADLDGDGDEDLYVTNLGPDVLYRNEGDGTFTAVDGDFDDGWGSSAAALDLEPDGDLDLFVVRYVHWSPAIEVDCYGLGGVRDYCHPSRYQSPASDLLYRNDGGLVFRDVSEEAGLRSAFGNGLGTAVLDFLGDGRPEVYVANDGMPNQLWIQETDGGVRLVDRAVPLGCAVNAAGAAEAGMGVAVGDVDGDGRFDLFVTHLGRETNTLYRNAGGLCEDVTARAGLAAPSLPFTGFGTGFADFDHDGRLDLWVTNGRVGREDLETAGDPFAEPDHVYRGLGEGRFELLEPAVSGVGGIPENGRGTAFADYDADGDVDVLVVNNHGPARLHRNRAGGGSWVQLRLGAAGEAAALGTAVAVRAGGATLWRPVQRAYSYCSSNDPAIHVGLGESERIEELRILRPGGRTLALRDLPARKTYRLP